MNKVHYHIAGIDGPICYAFNWRSKSQRFKETIFPAEVTCKLCLTYMTRRRVIFGWREVLKDGKRKIEVVTHGRKI